MAMDLREGQKLFYSQVVHFENEVPVQIEERYVNPQVVPDYLKQDFTRITPNAYLTALAPMTEGEHVVEAVLGNASECKLLKIERGEPCLLIRRRTWAGRVVVASARLLYPGSRYRLEGKFHS
ncbi:UTRA domain protein [compost metagenome]